MIYRVYAESGSHAEAICLIDAGYYDGGLCRLLEEYFAPMRMIVTEGAEENLEINEVFKQLEDKKDE